MLTIRLSRIGKKNQPLYRLIISEKTKDPYGRALEILGSYNPFTKQLQAKSERIKYWISKGAQLSPTVNNLLVEKKIIEGKKVTASKPGEKKKAAAAGKKEGVKAAEVKGGLPSEPEQAKKEESQETAPAEKAEEKTAENEVGAENKNE